jgi:hypothetical protein
MRWCAVDDDSAAPARLAAAMNAFPTLGAISDQN